MCQLFSTGSPFQNMMLGAPRGQQETQRQIDLRVEMRWGNWSGTKGKMSNAHTHTPTKNRPSSHPLWHASMSVVINSKLQPISLLRSPWSTFVVPPHLSTSMLSQPTRQRMPLSTASPGGARPGLGESWQNGSNESDRTLFQFPLVPLPRPSEKPPLSKVLKPN